MTSWHKEIWLVLWYFEDELWKGKPVVIGELCGVSGLGGLCVKAQFHRQLRGRQASVWLTRNPCAYGSAVKAPPFGAPQKDSMGVVFLLPSSRKEPKVFYQVLSQGSQDKQSRRHQSDPVSDFTDR